MLMVIPNEGKSKWLENAIPLETAAGQAWWVRLYKNDYTPVDGTTGADFTQADFTGYAQFEVLPENFSAIAIVANVAESTHNVPPVYECTGGSPQTVYGWYMIGQTNGIVYAAQRFNTPRVMVTGSVETLDPFKIRLKTFT